MRRSQSCWSRADPACPQIRVMRGRSRPGLSATSTSEFGPIFRPPPPPPSSIVLYRVGPSASGPGVCSGGVTHSHAKGAGGCMCLSGGSSLPLLPRPATRLSPPSGVRPCSGSSSSPDSASAASIVPLAPGRYGAFHPVRGAARCVVRGAGRSSLFFFCICAAALGRVPAAPGWLRAGE